MYVQYIVSRKHFKGRRSSQNICSFKLTSYSVQTFNHFISIEQKRQTFSLGQNMPLPRAQNKGMKALRFQTEGNEKNEVTNI